MSTSQILPPGTYAAGTYNLGPAVIPTGASGFTFAFDKTHWTDPAITLDIQVDVSLDGGTSWAPERLAADLAAQAAGDSSFSHSAAADPMPFGFGAEGGGLDKFGNPYTEASGTTSLPQPTNTQRRIKAVLVVSGGSIQTSCILTVI